MELSFSSQVSSAAKGAETLKHGFPKKQGRLGIGIPPLKRQVNIAEKTEMFHPSSKKGAESAKAAGVRYILLRWRCLHFALLSALFFFFGQIRLIVAN